MVASAVTTIMLKAMVENGDLPEYLQERTSSLGLSRSESIEFASNYVMRIVAASMNGSTMPGFAQDVLDHTLASVVDWKYVAERLLVTAEAN